MEPKRLWAAGEMAARIREFDWDETPLGPMRHWPTSLTTALNLVLENPVPMVLIWGRELVMLHNDAYQTMMNAPLEALGGSYLAAWVAIQEVVTPQIEQAFAGKSIRVERQGFDVLQPDGGFVRRFFDYSFSPVRADNGEVAGLLHIGYEITSRERAYKAVSTSEARLRAAIDNVPVGVAIVDTNGEFVVSNEEYWRYLPTGKMPSHDPERGCRWQAWDEGGGLVDPQQYPGARALRGELNTQGMEFLYTDDEGREIWTNVATAPIRDNFGKVTGAASVITDITERKRNTERLSRSEKRSAFLLKLSDAVRPLTDATVIRRTACTILGEHLSADWAYFIDYSVEAGFGVVDQDFSVAGLSSLSGRYPLEVFRTTSDHLANGHTWVVSDARNEHQIDQAERDYYVERNLISWINVPLVKGGVLNAMLSIVQTKPRKWSESEVEIVEEAAERLWATVGHARAETALRESEVRLKTLIEGIPQLVWRADLNGGWTWSSPQWENLTGLTNEDSSGDGWLKALHPDDRSAAKQAWSGAAATLSLDFDCRLCDAATGEYRWFQTRAQPVQMLDATVLEWLGTCTDVHDLRELQDRQFVLVGELQHRTRNLMAVIRSMCEVTARGSLDYSEFRAKFVIRLDAMARAQGLLSRLQGDDRVTFDELFEAEITAVRGDEAAGKVSLSGPRGVSLRSSAVQTLAMALHELTTNALKYGALSQDKAKLEVSWMLEPADDGDITDGEPWLRIDWRERGVQMKANNNRGPGHGRELIESALPFQLGARTKYELGPDGVNCTIWIQVSKQHVREGLEHG